MTIKPYQSDYSELSRACPGLLENVKAQIHKAVLVCFVTGAEYPLE